MKLISKIQKRIILFSHQTKYFGIRCAFWDLLDSQRHRIIIFSKFIHQRRHNAVINYLEKKYKYFIASYTKSNNVCPFQGFIPNQIWICWWDGIHAMPPIVNACYNSVLHYANDFQVTVITRDNFNDFISIPAHVLEKVKSGIITITHLSDIIRMSLLEKYGGLWLDATVLVTGTIKFDNISFFTIKNEPEEKYISKRKWAGNCIGGIPKLPLFNFVHEFLCEYWKKHNDMIDYFLIDYSILLAYNAIPQIKDIIDSVTQNNEKYLLFHSYLENEYNSNFYEEATKNTIFHKLFWKKCFSTVTSENKLTLYGYILKNMGIKT